LIDRGVAPEDIVLTFRHPVREGDTLLVAEAD
jgi:hypothetical protein